MPTQHSLRLFIVSFLLFSTLLWWPGEVVAKSIVSIASEPLTRANNFGRPVLTPEQVLQGVLRLAEVVPKQRQLTPGMVREATGIWLKPKENDPERFSFAGGMTTPEWFYAFSLYSDDSIRGRIFRVRFSAKEGVNERTTPFDAVCRLSLVDMDRALHKAGYTRGKSFPRRDIHYRNGDISILILSTFTKTANCVQYMEIYLPDSTSGRNRHE